MHSPFRQMYTLDLLLLYKKGIANAMEKAAFYTNTLIPAILSVHLTVFNFYHGICRPNGLSKPGIPVVEWYNHTTKNLHLQAQKLISAARRTTTKPGFHASGFCIIHMSNQMISISYIHPECLPDKHS